MADGGETRTNPFSHDPGSSLPPATETPTLDTLTKATAAGHRRMVDPSTDMPPNARPNLAESGRPEGFPAGMPHVTPVPNKKRILDDQDRPSDHSAKKLKVAEIRVASEDTKSDEKPDQPHREACQIQ